MLCWTRRRSGYRCSIAMGLLRKQVKTAKLGRDVQHSAGPRKIRCAVVTSVRRGAAAETLLRPQLVDPQAKLSPWSSSSIGVGELHDWALQLANHNGHHQHRGSFVPGIVRPPLIPCYVHLRLSGSCDWVW
jgi:hypothetical protein